MTIIADQPGTAEQQPDPITVKRAAYVKGLRALADILDAHPELPLPYTGTGLSALNWIEIRADMRRGAAIFTRAMPGTVDKSVSDDTAGQFYLTFKLHGLNLKWIASRAEMCERIVVGTREVKTEEPDPVALAALPKIKRTEVVEDVEWQCRPVLAADELPAGGV